MIITQTPFRMSFFGGGTDFSGFSNSELNKPLVSVPGDGVPIYMQRFGCLPLVIQTVWLYFGFGDNHIALRVMVSVLAV